MLHNTLRASRFAGRTTSTGVTQPLLQRHGLPLAFAATIVIAAETVWLSAPAKAQAPISNIYAFTNLGTLANLGLHPTSSANSIENGVIVGDALTGNSRALRWNADGSVTNLNLLANLGNNALSSAQYIKNGVAVGSGRGSNTGNRQNALRWNADGTVTNLHSLANLGSSSFSTALGYDNGVTVGIGQGSNTEDHANALRWNADGTFTNLNTVANFGAGVSTAAQATSGGVTVGSRFGTPSGVPLDYYNHAIRWNADDTVTNLEDLVVINYGPHTGEHLGTLSHSNTYAISGGYTVGVGFGSGTNYNEVALRWRPDDKVDFLFDPSHPGIYSSTVAYGTAGNVSVGYGYSSHFDDSDYYEDALLWDANGNSLNLQQFVTGNSTNSVASGIDTTTGIVVGHIGGTYFGEQVEMQAAMWTPLNTGAGGANAFLVQSGVTTTINRNFTQSAGQTTVNGRLTVDDNNFGNGAETFTLAGGQLDGGGTITGNLVNTGGIVSPGNSPGTLTINGKYAQSGAGILKIEIASLSDFDTLNIIGNASLGGTLDISFLGAYEPALGDSFDFLQAKGSMTGAFDVITITGGNLYARGLVTQINPGPGGNGFSIDLVEVVVPEPGGIALLSLAIPALGAWIARRRNK